MTFEEAEVRFREIQARVQRGEAISRAEYEDQVSQLAVQDDRGVLWEINPRTGKWMYFDGAEWVGGTPPGRDHSSITPATRTPTPPPPTPAPATPPPPASSTPASIGNPPGRMGSSTRPVSPGTGRPGPAPVSSPRRTGQGPVPSTGAPTKEAAPSRQANPEQGGPPPGGGPTGGPQMPPRVLRQGPLGPANREWVPLAVGAVVLLLCAVLLFFGGRFVLAALGPAPTPTRVAVNTPSSGAVGTAMPTVARLPTQALSTPTPQQVIGKIIERSVNVRQTPSTKAKVLTTLKKDNQIALIARNEASDWYQVTITGSTAPGWVFGETMEIVSGDPRSLPVAGSGAAPAPTIKAPTGPQVTPTLTPIGQRP